MSRDTCPVCLPSLSPPVCRAWGTQQQAAPASDSVLPPSFLSSFQWFQQVVPGEGPCSETQKQRGHSGEGEAQRCAGRRTEGAGVREPPPHRPRRGLLGQGAHRSPPPPRSPSPPFCSGWHLPLSRRRVLPIHRTDPAVKARGCSGACLCREAAKSPGDRKKGSPAGKLEGHSLFALPRDLLSEQVAKMVR